MTSTITQQKKASQQTSIEHIKLGQSLVKQALYFEAFDHFKQAIQHQPNTAIDILTYLYKWSLKQTQLDVPLHIILAKLYLEIEFIPEAFEILDELLLDAPNEIIIYEEMAKLSTNKQLRKRIQHRFEVAINHNIFFAPIISLLPQIYCENKHYSSAIKLYQLLIQKFPDQHEYYKLLSELYFRKRDYTSASDVLNELIRLSPSKSQDVLPSIQKIIQKIPRHIDIRLLYIRVLFSALKATDACNEIRILIKYHPSQKESACNILKKQQQAFPNHPDILILLSELLIQLNHFTESIEYIQIMIKDHPSYSDHCLEIMQQIIKKYPQHALALELTGHIYFNQQNYPQALHYFDKCVNLLDDPTPLGLVELLNPIHQNNEEPSQHRASLVLAKIYSKSNEIEHALTIINKLSQTEEAVEAQLIKADIHNQTQKFHESLTILKDCIVAHPFHWDLHQKCFETFKKSTQYLLNQSQKSTQSSEQYLQRCSQLLANGNIAQTIDILQQPIDSIPNDDVQLLLSRCYFESSRYDLCIQILKRHAQKFTEPNHIHAAYYWMGISHLLLSNVDDAIESFECLETFDRNYLTTQQLLTRLRQNKYLNHHGLVIVGGKSICSQFPNNQPLLRASHHHNRDKKSQPFEVIGFSQSYNDDGCKQFMKQQYKSAKESFELAIQMDPQFHTPFLNLAMLYLQQTDVDSALEQVSIAERTCANCPFVHYIKALCYAHKDTIDMSIRHIQQSIKLNPNESIFYIMLGDLFYATRQLELAITHWDKATINAECGHLLQTRYRHLHFDQLSTNYWTTPEYLCLR